MTDSAIVSSRSFWGGQWGLSQATLLSTALLVNGWLIQFVTGVGIRPLSLPTNLVGLALFWCVLAALTWRWSHSPFIRWLSGIPMAIASMTQLGLLALISGFIPQGGEGWLQNITGTWSFALVLLLVLTNLGLATLRRLLAFQGWHDAGFIANHAGLWIVLAGMAAGAGDLKRVRIIAPESVQVRSGIAQDGTPGGVRTELPFGIELQKFTIEEYPPKLAFYGIEARKPMKAKPSRDQSPRAGTRFEFDGFHVELLDVIPSAAFRDGNYVPAEHTNGIAAWRVKVVTEKGVAREGWLSPGKGEIPPKALHIDKGVLALHDPEARLYRSDVMLLDSFGKPQGQKSIEVNKPLPVSGWKLYQASYEPDPTTGAVRSTIIEAVFDPWLPVVYFGAFLMLAGTAHLFYTGLRRAPGGATP